MIAVVAFFVDIAFVSGPVDHVGIVLSSAPTSSNNRAPFCSHQIRRRRRRRRRRKFSR
jgi:hypothetical protein